MNMYYNMISNIFEGIAGKIRTKISLFLKKKCAKIVSLTLFEIFNIFRAYHINE